MRRQEAERGFLLLTSTEWQLPAITRCFHVDHSRIWQLEPIPDQLTVVLCSGFKTDLSSLSRDLAAQQLGPACGLQLKG